MSKTGKAICQYCNRPTPDRDLVRWMCSLCRAFYGHIPEPKLRESILKKLQKLLQDEINWLTARIAQTQSQKPSVGRDVSLKDDREILAEKQEQLMRVKQFLGQQIEFTGQDIRNDRIARKLSQTEYSKLLDVTPRHLRRVEKCLNGINNKMLTRLKNVRF